MTSFTLLKLRINSYLSRDKQFDFMESISQKPIPADNARTFHIGTARHHIK